jgi:hypothetical protein
MPWVKLDEHFRHHPKIVQAGPVGMAMYVCGLSYAAQYLTDGLIVAEAVRSLVDMDGVVFVGMNDNEHIDPFDVAARLVQIGLWDDDPRGFRIHDYLEYNPSKLQVLAERAAKVAAGRAGGIAAATARASGPAKALATAPAVAKSKPVTVPDTVSDSSPEAVQNARDDERWDAPETEALQWLAKHGCDIRPGNGYHRNLITLVEVHGINAVVGMFDRLASAGMKQGDTQGYVFGAKDALNAKGRPDLRSLERDEAAQERTAVRNRRIQEGMWARRIERFQQTGQWEPEWGEPPSKVTA